MAGKPIQINTGNFDTEVINSKEPILVDFWATWCGPCLAIAPALVQIAAEYDGRFKIGKVNVDNDQSLAMRFGITSIPTLLLFKDGKIQESIVGSRSKSAFVKLVEKYT